MSTTAARVKGPLRRLAAPLMAAGLMSIVGSEAFAFTLPTADCNPSNDPANAGNLDANCLTFTDFNVFSLPLLDLKGINQLPGGTADGNLQPGEANYVTSTYGQIQNYTIVGINNGQSTATGNPPASMDGSYNTPSQNNEPAFSTYHGVMATDPAGGPATGDLTTKWDADISSLLSVSQGTPLVFFFAFNETGSTTGLATTDLLVWAKVTVYNYCGVGSNDAGSPGCIAGSVIGSQDFYMQYSGDATKYTDANTPNPQTLVAGNPTGAGLNQSNVGPYAYVHAGICVAAGNFVGFPDSNGNCPVGSLTYEQANLGQNAAAFAVNSPTLDSALTSGNFDVMSISWNMAYVNGGGETLWILPTNAEPCTENCGPNNVPEPATLGLLGLGLLGIGIRNRRKQGGVAA